MNLVIIIKQYIIIYTLVGHVQPYIMFIHQRYPLPAD